MALNCQTSKTKKIKQNKIQFIHVFYQSNYLYNQHNKPQSVVHNMDNYKYNIIWLIYSYYLNHNLGRQNKSFSFLFNHSMHHIELLSFPYLFQLGNNEHLHLTFEFSNNSLPNLFLLSGTSYS